MKKLYTSITLCIFCLTQFITTQNLKAQNCWMPLGSGVNGSIEALGVYNGNLIIAGVFDSVGGIAANNIAQWNGSSWSPLGSGIKTDTAHSRNFDITSLTEYNGEIYVAGQFDTAGGLPVSNIAKWNGSSWSAVGSGISGTGYTIASLIVYNGALYAGGTFDSAGGISAAGIAKWDGLHWLALDSGRGNVYGQIICFALHNGILYCGGQFSRVGNVYTSGIASWNDTTWSALGRGLSQNQAVHSIAFYQGVLYETASDWPYTDSISEWDGTVWSQIGQVTPGFPGVNVLFTFDGKLIAGGSFNAIDGIAASNMAEWDGSAWSAFGGGVSASPAADANIITTYNGYLYAGGYFTQAGSTAANSIAQYTCATDGIHDIPSSAKTVVYPNPTTGKLNISTENVQPGSSVLVYDLLGKQIYKSNISSRVTEINLNDRAPGVYLYRISQENGALISTGTIIIQ